MWGRSFSGFVLEVSAFAFVVVGEGREVEIKVSFIFFVGGRFRVTVIFLGLVRSRRNVRAGSVFRRFYFLVD